MLHRTMKGGNRRSPMRNLETSAFGAAALVAQALVIAAILAA
ncbi:MAG: hypothetical protein V4537_17420 [Pseudomonadota bacterium]